MACVECGASFSWEAPGHRGVMQGWYRHSEDGPRGRRCEDRKSCKARQAATQPSLLD